MEIVFDKGVDAVYSSNYHYLIEIITRIKYLFQSDIFVSQPDIQSLFNEKYNYLANRLNIELDSAFKSMNNDNMSYNEIKYSKIVYHLMFFKKLIEYCNKENQILNEEIYLKLIKNRENLNCFMQKFI